MKGLTLLEILIAIGIFSFIIVGIFSVLSAGGANSSANFVSLNLQQQARQAMNWLSGEAREAYFDASDAVSEGELHPMVIGSNSITFDTPDKTRVRYYVDSAVVSGKMLSQLKRTDSLDPVPKIKANDIISLVCSRGSGHLLNITVTAGKTFRSQGKSQTPEFSLTEQVQVRN